MKNQKLKCKIVEIPSTNQGKCWTLLRPTALEWHFQGKKRETEQNRGFLGKPQINTDFLPQITQIFVDFLLQIGGKGI